MTTEAGADVSRKSGRKKKHKSRPPATIAERAAAAARDYARPRPKDSGRLQAHGVQIPDAIAESPVVRWYAKNHRNWPRIQLADNLLDAHIGLEADPTDQEWEWCLAIAKIEMFRRFKEESMKPFSHRGWWFDMSKNGKKLRYYEHE